MHLRIALLEPHVLHVFDGGDLACARDHRRRNVDARRAARRGRARRIAGGQAGAAADVQHAIAGENGAGAAEYGMVQLQLAS